MELELEERPGNWIETFSGVHFYPLDPLLNEIVAEDIAHALSLICRFTGHTKWLYTVGQHCLLCADRARMLGAPARVQLRALLHDGSEAYICDVSRPVKPFLSNYLGIEHVLQGRIYERFGLPFIAQADEKVVKSIDDELLAMEARTLMPRAEWAANINVPEIAKQISYTPPQLVESRYLQKLNELKLEARCGC